MRLKTARGDLELGRRPVLMGVVNATPDSFSDGGTLRHSPGRGWTWRGSSWPRERRSSMSAANRA